MVSRRYKLRTNLAYTAVLAPLSAVMIASAALLPIERKADLMAQRQAFMRTTTDAMASTPSTPGRSLETYAPLWAATLQRPLPVSPSPPPPEPDPITRRNTEPTLSVMLLGVMLEPDGRARAVFDTGSRKLAVAATGDTVDGARLIRIADDHVVLDHHGEAVTLALPETVLPPSETSTEATPEEVDP